MGRVLLVKTRPFYPIKICPMKKLYLSLFVLIFSSFINLWAKKVTEQQARQFAVTYSQINKWRSATIQEVTVVADLYYIINFNPQGWMIVSGDDTVNPILGYSQQGSIKKESLPQNMLYILEEYSNQIRKIAKITTEPHVGWTNIAGISTRSSKQAIEPLIKVNWNQDAPYNTYCPQQQALVGCVAVAMGQAMSVQRYPARPKGSISYTSANYGKLSINYENEMAYNWDDILAGANNYNEVARFLYHAGMSVRMDYGIDGSGIPSNEVNRISDALKNIFSYPEDVQYIWREYYDEDWEQLLINELNAGRAIIYNAVDTEHNAGHSFNLDGYDGNGMFHVNWGWGSYGNGYFPIDNLRDASMNMAYDSHHVAVIGIGAPDQVLKSISLSNRQIEEGLKIGSTVGQILVNGTTPKSTFEINVHGVYNSTLGKYMEVPFQYKDGMLITTEILHAQTSSWDVEITVTDTESKSSLTQGFRINVIPWMSIEETSSLKYDRTTKVLLLKTKHNVSYRILSENGNELSKGTLEPLPELKIDLNTLPKERLTIELTCGEEKKTFNIITTKN